MTAEIVKENKVIKVYHVKGSVKATLNRAIQKAKEQNWSKIVIIGEGHTDGGTLYSRMSDNTRYGLIERAKLHMAIVDERDGYL